MKHVVLRLSIMLLRFSLFSVFVFLLNVNSMWSFYQSKTTFVAFEVNKFIIKTRSFIIYRLFLLFYDQRSNPSSMLIHLCSRNSVQLQETSMTFWLSLSKWRFWQQMSRKIHPLPCNSLTNLTAWCTSQEYLALFSWSSGSPKHLRSDSCDSDSPEKHVKC